MSCLGRNRLQGQSAIVVTERKSLLGFGIAPLVLIQVRPRVGVVVQASASKLLRINLPVLHLSAIIYIKLARVAEWQTRQT